MFARWQYSVSTGEPYRVANRLRRRDGEYRHCESRAQPQRDDSGKIVRWYGTTEDIHERTVAEQLLRTSEARRVLALEGAQLATWDWNIRAGEVIRDARWFAMLGFEENAATRQAAFWQERIHPDDRGRINKLWETHCNDETQAYRAEYRIRDNSGEWRWMLTHGRVVERDHEGPTRACGINQDVTERRRFEDALANSERFSRLLLEASQDCVALLDESGCMLYLNRVGRQHLGIDEPNGANGRSWIDVWREADRAVARQRVAAAFAGQSAAFQAFSSLDETLSLCWDIVLSPIAQSSDQPRRILAVAREITRIKEQQERQREAVERERLQVILENLNEGIVIAAPDRAVLLMNGAARRMYGFNPGPDKEINCDDLFGAVEAADIVTGEFISSERPLARAIRGEVFSGMDTLLQDRVDGRQWIASCGSTPLRSASGELLLAVLSIRDVTEERKAAEEIRRANQVLHELSGRLLRLQDEERKRIARELHDGTVQGLSAALMNLTLLADSEEIRKFEFEGRLVEKALKLVHQSVNEIRTLSYLLHPPVLDELGLVPALRSWIDGFSERAGIPVDIYMPEHMDRLPSNVETALFRITQEALGNVHRHAESTAAGVRLQISQDTIVLEIVDDGKGFDFAQLSKAGADRRFGVGLLGMRERASQLGGSLTVESNPGKTLVRVSLPRSTASA